MNIYIYVPSYTSIHVFILFYQLVTNYANLIQFFIEQTHPCGNCFFEIHVKNPLPYKNEKLVTHSKTNYLHDLPFHTKPQK